MNPSTLIFLGLAVVWAVVLLPELFRKMSGSRSSDSIRSFNQQLSVLHRSGTRRGADLPGMGRPAGLNSPRSNVIDLRRPAGGPVTNRGLSPQGLASTDAPRGVPTSVKKRRQEVLTVLGSAAVLTLLCTVAFGGVFFLGAFVVACGLLVAYVALLAQLNQAPRTNQAAIRNTSAPSLSAGMRTATVGRATPAPRRIAN